MCSSSASKPDGDDDHDAVEETGGIGFRCFLQGFPRSDDADEAPAQIDREE